MIRSLFDAGVDMFRLNFSHGTHGDHKKRFEAIRDVERDVGRPIGIMIDLQGPKLRIGTFSDGPVELRSGDKFSLDVNPISTWSDLARVNSVTETSDGSLQNGRDVYTAHLYAVMALSSPLIPEVKPLFEWLTSAMRDSGGRLPWRDSFAV